MTQYFREEQSKVLLKGLRRLGLEIKRGKNHDTATSRHTQRKTTLPRHTKINKHVVNSICGFLIENGYTEEEIEKAFRWK